MIVALDAGYDEAAATTVGAVVVFQRWDDAAPCAEYVAECDEVAAYVPGQFYRRELPALLEVLKQVQEPLELALIDGYVSLGERPGLGWRLWDAIGRRYPAMRALLDPLFRD